MYKLKLKKKIVGNGNSFNRRARRENAQRALRLIYSFSLRSLRSTQRSQRLKRIYQRIILIILILFKIQNYLTLNIKAPGTRFNNILKREARWRYYTIF
jgi:hypothetical protein